MKLLLLLLYDVSCPIPSLGFGMPTHATCHIETHPRHRNSALIGTDTATAALSTLRPLYVGVAAAGVATSAASSTSTKSPQTSIRESRDRCVCAPPR